MLSPIMLLIHEFIHFQSFQFVFFAQKKGHFLSKAQNTAWFLVEATAIRGVHQMIFFFKLQAKFNSLAFPFISMFHTMCPDNRRQPQVNLW